MSYSSGPGGYGGPPQGPNPPSYGPPSQPYGASPGPSQGTGEADQKGLPFYLTIGVIALGVLSFLLGFAPYSGGVSTEFGGESISVNTAANFFETLGVVSISLLLAAALVAALGLLPKQDINNGVVTSLSVVGFISLLFQLITFPGEMKLGFGLILVLVLSFLQAALAIAVLLFAADVIKPPQPKQQQYGYYGPGGGYSQPPQSQPQQPYYGGSPGPGSYQQHQPPPSQPPQQPNRW